MPTVKGRKYPYTKEGKSAARKARKRSRMARKSTRARK